MYKKEKYQRSEYNTVSSKHHPQQPTKPSLTEICNVPLPDLTPKATALQVTQPITIFEQASRDKIATLRFISLAYYQEDFCSCTLLRGTQEDAGTKVGALSG